VESLLRQDPEERPDAEELRGWLRSLVRSAPEPDLGLSTVPVPADDPHKLPVVRRRGELVRRRKAAADPVPAPSAHGRHKRTKERRQRSARGPRSLGVTLVGLVLLLMVAAVLYAVLFMPRGGPTGDEGAAGATPAEFPAIDLPTLFVWSDQDPAIGPEGPYATEKYVTAPYRFVILEGIGHWIPEMAADRFSSELLAHLAAYPV